MSSRETTRDKATQVEHNAWIALLAVTTVVLLTLASLSLARYEAYNYVSFDMARMRQAMWNTMHGRPLLVTAEGMAVSRLADHVEIIFLLISPVYYLFRSAAFLIFLQAALYGLGAIPVYRLAGRRLQNARTGLAFALIYLFYPVIQTAVLFEFHGDTLAMPLLLFALEAGDRRAWRAYTVWTALALACKMYVAIPVAAMGTVYFLQDERRAGLLTFLSAAIWGAVAFFIIRGFFAPPENAALAKADAVGYVGYYFGQLLHLGSSWQLRLVHGLIAALPALLLGLRAPLWLLVAGTIAGPVLISTGPGPVYSSEYHHYALAAPFLVMAMIAGADRLNRIQRASGEPGQALPWQRALKFTLGLTLLLNILVVDHPLNPRFYFASEGSGRGLSRSGYVSEARDRFKDAWLGQAIGPHERVAADHLLGQRLVNRTVLVTTKPEFASLEDALAPVDYVIVDALYDLALGDEEAIVKGGVRTEHDTLTALLQDEAWTLQESRDGLVMFSRSARGLQQAASVSTVEEEAALMARFGDLIGLVDAELSHVAGNRWRLSYEWVALQDLGGDAPFMAVTRMDGAPFSRIVHLPTIGLAPTTEWQPHTTVWETFEFEAPEEIATGSYPLYVSWYRTDSLYSSQTDERTRIGAEVAIGILEVEDPNQFSQR